MTTSALPDPWRTTVPAPAATDPATPFLAAPRWEGTWRRPGLTESDLEDARDYGRDGDWRAALDDYERYLGH